jgi:trigger factor
LDRKINQLSTAENQVEITLSPEEASPLIQAEVAKKITTIQIPGFRKGKAPKHVIKNMYGDSLEYDAADKVANKIFWDSVKELDLRPLNTPGLVDLNYKPGEALSFKVNYEIFPEIEVKNFKGNEIEIPLYEVNDQLIEEELKNLLNSNADFEVVDTLESAENCIVDIDIYNTETSTEMGTPKAIEGDYPLISDTFKASLPSLKVGDLIKPADFYSEQKLIDSYEKTNYQFIIKGFRKKKLPELNDEFVQSISKEYKDVASLREGIAAYYTGYYEDMTNKIYNSRLEKSILDANEFQVPSSFVERVLNYFIKEETEKAKKENKPLPKAEDLKLAYKPYAEKEAKWQVLKENIIRVENLTVTDEYIEEMVKKEVERYDISADILRDYFKGDSVKNNLLYGLLDTFLKEQNPEKKIDPEEYRKKYVEKHDHDHEHHEHDHHHHDHDHSDHTH